MRCTLAPCFFLSPTPSHSRTDSQCGSVDPERLTCNPKNESYYSPHREEITKSQNIRTKSSGEERAEPSYYSPELGRGADLYTAVGQTRGTSPDKAGGSAVLRRAPTRETNEGWEAKKTAPLAVEKE